MITYEKLKDKPQVFKSLIGLTLPAFLELLPAFRRAYEYDLDRRDAQREQPRQRGRGGGRQGALAGGSAATHHGSTHGIETAERKDSTTRRKHV